MLIKRVQKNSKSTLHFANNFLTEYSERNIHSYITRSTCRNSFRLPYCRTNVRKFSLPFSLNACVYFFASFVFFFFFFFFRILHFIFSLFFCICASSLIYFYPIEGLFTMLQRNWMCLVKLFCRCQYMLFCNFGKIIIKPNKINVKKIYSPSDVQCFGGRLEYPSSVTVFFSSPAL